MIKEAYERYKLISTNASYKEHLIAFSKHETYQFYMKYAPLCEQHSHEYKKAGMFYEKVLLILEELYANKPEILI